VERPSYREFAKHYLRARKPVLITGGMDDWSAMRTWSFESIGARLGNRMIRPVVMDRGNFRIDLHAGVRVESMTFPAYAERIANTDAPPYYLRLPLEGEYDELFTDYEIPVYCRRRIFLKRNLWVGGRGASSDLHYDMTHNVVAQVTGHRRVLLFGPEQSDALHPFPLRTLNWHHSQVHVDAPDLARFPRYRDARPIELEIKRGEMLFLPQGFWHRFETLEPSIAVNFFWLTLGLAPRMALSRLAWVASGIRT
jgi:hypothetical protein